MHGERESKRELPPVRPECRLLSEAPGLTDEAHHLPISLEAMSAITLKAIGVLSAFSPGGIYTSSKSAQQMSLSFAPLGTPAKVADVYTV